MLSSIKPQPKLLPINFPFLNISITFETQQPQKQIKNQNQTKRKNDPSFDPSPNLPSSPQNPCNLDLFTQFHTDPDGDFSEFTIFTGKIHGGHGHGLSVLVAGGGFG